MEKQKHVLATPGAAVTPTPIPAAK
jgi:hypothetical protein